MSIPEVLKKINPYWQNKAIPVISRVKEGFDLKDDTFMVLAIILIGLAGFGLGRLSALEKGREMVAIKPAQFMSIIASTTVSANSQVPLSASAMIAGESAEGLLVASKSGTKYYFPWCAGVSKISEKNKVWFDTYEAAQKAGLTAAANCAGLK